MTSRVMSAGRPSVRSLLGRLPVTAWDAVPAAVAFCSTTAVFNERRAVALDPDARGYLILADTFGIHTLWGGVREPVWPLIAAIPVQILGPHPSILRGLGLIFFPLLVIGLQWCARPLAGPHLARIAALIVALSPWLRLETLEGLREDPCRCRPAVLCWLSHTPRSHLRGRPRGEARR